METYSSNKSSTQNIDTEGNKIKKYIIKGIQKSLKIN